jgi:hypothetical protein
MDFCTNSMCRHDHISLIFLIYSKKILFVNKLAYLISTWSTTAQDIYHAKFWINCNEIFASSILVEINSHKSKSYFSQYLK